jgi:hypothetical protein
LLLFCGSDSGVTTQEAERISRPMAARALRRLSIDWDCSCIGRTVRLAVASMGRNTVLTASNRATATEISTTVIPASLR